jgi:hypothetical protein
LEGGGGAGLLEGGGPGGPGGGGLAKDGANARKKAVIAAVRVRDLLVFLILSDFHAFYTTS